MKAKATFTPGPWIMDKGRFGHQEVEALNGRGLICALGDSNLQSEEIKANAQLIAAAPEMLQTLESILEEFIDDKADQGMLNDPYTLSRVNQAKEAINKAKGD